LSTTEVELRKLLAGSRGEVIVARRLTHEEASMFERRRVDCDADAHASLIPKEEAQFRRPRRGDNRIESAKLAVREAPDAGDEFDKHRGGAGATRQTLRSLRRHAQRPRRAHG
jgi:hypothetical protein